MNNYVLDHLDRMSDERAMFEHAARTVRLVEHGYCVDDNARLLLVTSREPDIGVARRLSRLALRYVLDSQAPDGRVHNRMNIEGKWTDHPSTFDCWGRAVWGLGAAANNHRDTTVRSAALSGFLKSAARRSPYLRSMVFASLGAAEVVQFDPTNPAALSLLSDTLDMIGLVPSGLWRWPENRLTYASASIAEATIAAGAALERPFDRDRGLVMLAWLMNMQTKRGHLSVTGTAGRTIDDDQEPQFDQQPIEVAAMADACHRAYMITGEMIWLRGLQASAGWFAGENDSGLIMHDETSGGGYDGLKESSVNTNQGAESTLAFISTMQRANAFASTR
jgi:hypothetical protein